MNDDAEDEGVPTGEETFKDFSDLLALGKRETSPGRSSMELKVRRRHLRSLEILHGGVAASLLDGAMGLAAGTRIPEDHYLVTIQLSVNFIRPAWEGETLVATGEVLHRGRQTAVCRGEIRTADAELVASGSATFLFVAHSPKTRKVIEKLSESPDRSLQGNAD